MSARSMFAVALALVVAVVAVGCGGSDDDAGSAEFDDSSSAEPATSSMTKAQFVNQANRACGAERENLLARAQAYQEETDTFAEEGTPQFAEATRRIFLSTFEAEVEAVRALGAPAGEKQRIEAVLTAQQEAIDDVAERGVETYAQIEAAFAEASELLREYGLRGCLLGGQENNG